MGIEAFGVSMQFTEPGIYSQLVKVLSNHSRIYFGGDESSGGYITVTGEYKDDRHFIDLQLRCEVANSKCTLAIRFSLCSYDSIDAIFMEIVKNVLASFEADVWLMTSALRQKAHYLPGDEVWLLAALPDEIAAMRDYWQSSFGNKQGCVRVKDSFSFVGIKFKE